MVMERPSFSFLRSGIRSGIRSGRVTPGRMVAVGLVPIFLVGLWWFLTGPAVTASVVTIEDGSLGAYDVLIPTPVLVEDERDRAKVVEALPRDQASRVETIDLDHSFALLATTEVCAPHLRKPTRLVIDGDTWWIGERPGAPSIGDLYNLCEEELVDFHVFEVERRHLAVFAGVPLARD